MSNGSDPSSDSSRDSSDPRNPYQLLGVGADDPFDVVQEARRARLEALGDDSMARARVEAAYDAVLMDRLKERQQGRVSSAARNASQREQVPAPTLRPTLPSLPQLPPGKLSTPAAVLPSLTLASGREFWIPLAANGLLVLLLLLQPSAPELLLSLATLVTLLNLQRRTGRFLVALGWSFALLVVGLLVGALVVGGLPANLAMNLPFTARQIESLPALLLLLLGALLID